MKLRMLIFFCVFVAALANGQERYLTKTGAITFFSEAPIENITADNDQVLSIIDATSHKMAISILIKSFLFEKALMQEHFNENYLESDKYPKATFKGEILEFDSVNAISSMKKVKGVLTMHGVSKEITIEATMKRTENSIGVEGDFMINLEDFKIKIPAVVSRNIAKNIKVSFNFNHKPFNKK